MLSIFSVTSSEDNFNGYDQFGSLYGLVHIEASDDGFQEIELNLPGMRQRRWLQEIDVIQRSVKIIGVCKDGSVFLLEAKSFEEHISQ